MKKTAAYIASVALAFGTVTAFAENSVLEETARYIKTAVPDPQIGSIGGEWSVIGLARSGYVTDTEYYDTYYGNVEEYVSAHGGILDERKYTEYSRVALALSAIGRDPQNVGGYDLLEPLGDFNAVTAQGINGSVFALLALDSGSYEMPQNGAAEVQATREMYVADILSKQSADGGFELMSGGGADVDITAMAMTALSNYTSDEKVDAAIERSVEYLSAVQNENGGFTQWGEENSESSAQVLVALSTLGIKADDERFVKNGKSVYDSLLSFKNGNGFAHEKGGEINLMSTEQALYALAAYDRAERGANKLYDMSDVEPVNTSVNVGYGLPGKNADVKVSEIISDSVSFDDIDAEHGKAAVEALAQRGIINGRAENMFMPSESMTRAEFATIIVRGLGLPMQSENAFADINDGDWFAQYVSTAAQYGIVNGISETEFDPYGTITREQAAAMTARSAALCGMDTAMESSAVMNMLAQFGDYRSVSEWARESMAFCYSSGILSQEDIDIEPSRAILRYEIAQMLYNMLSAARLMG